MIDTILKLLVIFLVASSFTVSANDKFTSLKQFPPHNPIRSECVVKPDRFRNWLFRKGDVSHSREKAPKAIKVFSEKPWQNLPSKSNISKIYPPSQYISPTSLQVITILQKNNIWHSSSDDLPPVLILN